MTRLRMRNFGDPWVEAEVTFRRCTHWSTTEHRGRPLRAYEVIRDGNVVGKVYEERETLESRTRGRTYVNRRWVGAKTVWSAAGKMGTDPTRAQAAARLLGYSFCEIVR